MTPSRQILASLTSGFVSGLLFGERAAALQGVAGAFVKLLQMMVLPCSSLAILGQEATPVSPRWSIIRDVLHWVE